MSNIDEDEILELEISDDETYGLHGVGSPGKRRRIAEEVPEVVSSTERTVTLLPNLTVPITLPLTSTSEQTLQKNSVGCIPWEDTEIPWDVSTSSASVPKKLSLTQYIQSSSSSASRVNIYRSRIPLVYPELAASETRFIRFVPIEDGSDREDDDVETYYFLKMWTAHSGPSLFDHLKSVFFSIQQQQC
jgi:hypothetical protein